MASSKKENTNQEPKPEKAKKFSPEEQSELFKKAAQSLNTTLNRDEFDKIIYKIVKPQ